MGPSLGRGQHPRQRRHTGRHAGDVPSRRTALPPATKHVALAALRRGRLPQLQELHPDAGERHSYPLRHRRLVRRRGHEQGMAATVIGRMGVARHHGSLRQKPGVVHRLASMARLRSQTRVQVFVQILGNVHCGQPTVILQVTFPIRRENL